MKRTLRTLALLTAGCLVLVALPGVWGAAACFAWGAASVSIEAWAYPEGK